MDINFFNEKFHNYEVILWVVKKNQWIHECQLCPSLMSITSTIMKFVVKQAMSIALFDMVLWSTYLSTLLTF